MVDVVSREGGPGPVRRLRLDAVHPDPLGLKDTAAIIRQGGLVAHPTETFYGLAVNPFDAKAVARLGALKGRSPERAVILLIAQTEMLFDLAAVTGTQRAWVEKLARRFWPGPLTLVLPARPRLRCPALAGGHTVAVRLSSHPIAWGIARALGAPITSTSANRAGAPPACEPHDIDASIAAGLDLIVDGGPTAGGTASTILDLSGERPVLARAGAIDSDRIGEVLGMMPRPALPAIGQAPGGAI